MQIAIEEAIQASKLGDVPVGAVIVINGEIVSRSHNLRETSNDATAHAEILAIREACRRLKRWRLNDATIYVTKEPCPMCAGAIVGARIKRLVYGCDDPKTGYVKTLYSVTGDARLNHMVEVVSGIFEKECRELLRDFFIELRNKE